MDYIHAHGVFFCYHAEYKKEREKEQKRSGTELMFNK